MAKNNILIEIKSILELKLNLIQIIIEKEAYIQKGIYEKASDLRLNEKEVYKFLDEKKINLIEGLSKINSTNSEDYFWFQTAISEIENLEILTRKNEIFTNISNHELNETFQNLIRLKEEVIKEHKIKNTESNQ